MIIKFDEHFDIPTTRIEYSYHLMATDAGLRMMPCRLFECENETHFLTERFDRKGNEKVYVQTLAAINPSACSYEELFETSCKIGVSPSELQQLFRAMVMNVLGGNVDDHNKNFSFIMEKDGQWHITPVYDYIFTVDPDAPFYINRHSMTINGKSREITKDDLLEIAGRYNIKAAESYIEKAVMVVKSYRSYVEKAGIVDYWIHAIEKEIASRIEALSTERPAGQGLKR